MHRIHEEVVEKIAQQKYYSLSEASKYEGSVSKEDLIQTFFKMCECQSGQQSYNILCQLVLINEESITFRKDSLSSILCEFKNGVSVHDPALKIKEMVMIAVYSNLCSLQEVSELIFSPKVTLLGRKVVQKENVKFEKMDQEKRVEQPPKKNSEQERIVEELPRKNSEHKKPAKASRKNHIQSSDDDYCGIKFEAREQPDEKKVQKVQKQKTHKVPEPNGLIKKASQQLLPAPQSQTTQAACSDPDQDDEMILLMQQKIKEKSSNPSTNKRSPPPPPNKPVKVEKKQTTSQKNTLNMFLKG